MSTDSQPSPERIAAAHAGDARVVVTYLVVSESDQYIAIMDVLETSVTDLAPREIGAALRTADRTMNEDVVEARLDQLREWGAVSARTDTSKILRHADLLARNWRYTATPAGRHVQRFFRTVLADTPSVREIPLTSLARAVEAAEALADAPPMSSSIADLIGRLFVNQDDLDAALVGAEDNMAGLVDRFDLDDGATAELKSVLVNYATRVAAELERGSARAYRALSRLRGRYSELAQAAVAGSEARTLIERGALSASRGGRVQDWEGLLAWFDPNAGRSERFALRLVRALPGMHINLRRLHSSSGTATSRSRALALAKACARSELAPSLFLAALGDHPWRKLSGEAEDGDIPGTCPWREGPTVEVPELLRLTGRSGARGRAPAARDDATARAAVASARARRVAEHDEAVREVLRAARGARLSERAARVAFAALLEAARRSSSSGWRTGARDGLACTLFHTAAGTGVLLAPTWRVLTPGRIPVFHLVGVLPDRPDVALEFDTDDAPVVQVVGGTP